jgi:hypothetical protein
METSEWTNFVQLIYANNEKMVSSKTWILTNKYPNVEVFRILKGLGARRKQDCWESGRCNSILRPWMWSNAVKRNMS